MKSNRYIFARKQSIWEYTTYANYRIGTCITNSISWSQRYPRTFTPFDVLQAELTIVEHHLKCMLKCNKTSEEFLINLKLYLKRSIETELNKKKKKNGISKRSSLLA